MECPEFARPLYEQRLERAMRLGPFLDQVEALIYDSLSDTDEDSDSEIYADYLKNGLSTCKREEREDRALMYNFTCVKKKRQWLKEVLLSSSEEDDDAELTEADLQEMLQEHKLRKKHQLQYYQKEENMSYMYYSAGLLSRVDKYPEHQKYLSGSKRKKNKDKKEKERKLKIIKEEIDNEDSKESLQALKLHQEETSIDCVDESSEELVVNLKSSRSKSNKKDKKPKKLDAQALAIRRHKLWVLMAKKEVGRCQKSKLSLRKEVLQNCKKMATGCMRYCRQKALQSQKTVKDKVWLLKRLTRTMQNEWKKYDRILKEQSKRAEREAEEQRKIDKEILEAKRQQRKMNFLITLPELYAHFMKNKMGASSSPSTNRDDETNTILKQLEDDHPLPSSVPDDYDSEAMKAQALRTAKDAYTSQISRANNFMGLAKWGEGPGHTPMEHSQPSIFEGQLKSYQLKGMNWLANLYYFGINGILADEMGLGKTVQSVAFLGHICEEYDTWGPFLIVTPASTLHNWTCEISRFISIFKVVPYWGNPEERKNLRKFFDGRGIGSREASFHVVVTSYQIVIQDFKFLNRLKWNYMVLDEAQAIKSINSQRWKQLLGFSCRNRLLLSGTPIQNSMAELWALLHFIMPTLFDSHNWFNEWFSKDIEGHVENKTAVDEKHLNRLHLILKPFMLRRVKTEVENELSDKIEVMMYCPLTLRQKYLYEGLRNKISIDELLRSSVNNPSLQSVTTSLMNLVMQFRKVCNHPELLERREVRSPFTCIPEPYHIPKLVYREGLLCTSRPSKSHLLRNHLSIFHPAHLHSTLKEEKGLNPFAFLLFIDMHTGELSKLALEGMLVRWIYVLSFLEQALKRHYRRIWGGCGPLGRDAFLLDPPLSWAEIEASAILSELVFTSRVSSFYTFTDHLIHFVPESHPHRLMRAQKLRRKRAFLEDLNADIPTVNSNILNSSLTNGDDPFEYLCPSPTEGALSSSTTPVASPGRGAHPFPGRSPRKGATNINIKIEQVGSSSFRDSSPLPEFPHRERASLTRLCQPTAVPPFLLHTCAKAHSLQRDMYASDRSAAYETLSSRLSHPSPDLSSALFGSPQMEMEWKNRGTRIRPTYVGGLWAISPRLGWNHVLIPDKHTLIMDAGKLYVLDSLLSRLKAGDHRVLIYSQMTKMIDLLEEYMWHRKHKYMRLDGSSKISDRRDMVEDFQNKSDIFVFLLSTRAGGVGINLTAADTVIFYDSDWNPTVDQQAMDRAHRLGQTKQVTVFRLICKDTIEERILQRACEKSEIQRMVISGGNFKPDTLKPKEVVSLLLDKDIEKEYRAKQAERRAMEDHKLELNREKMRERMRKRYLEKKWEKEVEKKRRLEEDLGGEIDVCGDQPPLISNPPSPALSEGSPVNLSLCGPDEASSDATLHIVDVESSAFHTSATSTPSSSTSTNFSAFSTSGPTLGTPLGRLSPSVAPLRRQRKRGRPRGSGSRGRRGTRTSTAGAQIVNGSLTPLDADQALNGENGSAQIALTTPVPTGAGGSTGLKRGRGRPRLLPLGPGHQGTRPPPALPVALGSTLGSNLNSNQEKSPKTPSYHFTSS